MKTLQLISSGGYYGAEAVVVSLSQQLNRLGVSSTVGVFHNAHLPNLETAEAAKLRGLDVEILPCSGRIDWKCVQALRGLVRHAGIDVIHTHEYKSHMYAYLATRQPQQALRSGSPRPPCSLIATCHGYLSRFREPSARLRQRLYAVLEEALLRRFDRVVAVSDILADSLRKARVAAERLSVITNGIDLNRFDRARASADLENIKAGRTAIGLVGRLIEGKGHTELFRALKKILVQYPNTLLFVVGDGPLRRPFEMQARELGIESSVVFTGKRTDMAGIYAALDVLALPSLNEGMPMTVLEALAARKAVVATRVGGIPEVILNERTGLLIEPSDTTALRNALGRLIANAELRRSLGDNGYALTRDRFSAASMAGKYLSLYQTALG